MSPALHAVGLVAVAMVFGSIAFFSFVVAPLIFAKLDAASAGRFVRGLFPWYYIAVAAPSLLALAALAAVRPVDAAIMGCVAAGALVARQILMPRINRHRDRVLAGDGSAERPFNTLHRLSVWINVAQLVGVFAVLLRMALVQV